MKTQQSYLFATFSHILWVADLNALYKLQDICTNDQGSHMH